MYNRGVNRGLAFTKPGLYCFGFILAVGMIAVATGINGLYIFLSAGLGGFIVSGMLSERAMKSVRIKRTAAAIVDADANFDMNFNIENQSPWFTLYAIQTFFFLKKPPLRLLSKPLPHLAAHTIGRIDPKTVITCKTQSNPLPRGSYHKLLSMQQTTFPFGLLEKYKFEEVAVGLTVTPAVDQQFLHELRQLIRKNLMKSDEDKEFFSHRHYSPQESIKHLDWKRSAGRKPNDWVIKVFNSTNLTTEVVIEAPWEIALNTKNTTDYEHWLGRVRTACLAIVEIGRDVALSFGGHHCIKGYNEALSALAEAPGFLDRHKLPNLCHDSNTIVHQDAPRLIIEHEGARWKL